ncbi:hypothetical protein [Pedobacter gandavensis]|uniref:Uncharacterized protein n=1 Tax=Pedobacter gandavensis TaxID=2679963 RepID=A0ABR6EWI5_9SPHI|nr:hypothetical protein [Pedobacter gandavensis]MBB2149159.1 hypothetical protein [Pedobacter gandavensis]
MNIEIKIAVKPIVKKYLSAKVKTDPMILSKTNTYGIFLYNCLVRISGKVRACLVGVDTEKYPEILKVVISEDMWQRRGWYLHPQKQTDFNNLITKMLDNEFHYYMDIQTQELNQKIYPSFLRFREKFDFTEDDLPIKTMEKNYQRYRTSLSA